ncbi:hypothetical protein AB0L74_30815 [Streptomyces sp. NPDC052020]|uniref:hypothetical protein n=1 Tax=Streptomyces sp. NPDC052020 TaxID=3155677 RepID=UPI00342B9147
MTHDATAHTLVVPVTLHGLAVNKAVRQKGFRRWQPVFNELRYHRSCEPAPFQGEDTWFDANDPTKHAHREGVHLRWDLPTALCTGAPAEPGSRLEFPLVPNRWLILRHIESTAENASGAVAGWVVESDYLSGRDGTTPFIHPYRAGIAPDDHRTTPYRSTLTLTRAGKHVGIGDTAWQEPSEGHRKTLFLTALGPGLVTFAAFQPYHEGVFSFHDPLTGIDDATVSYQVAGWYSDPAQEPLRTAQDAGSGLKDLLAAWKWAADPEGTGLPDDARLERTFYCGRFTGLAWDRTGEAPDCPARPEHKGSGLKVAVGNSADDALAALTTPTSKHRAFPPNAPALTHALSCGLLDALDEPDGDISVDQELHRTWFEPVHGGYRWHLTEHPDTATHAASSPGPTDAGESAEERLAVLNRNQLAHDEAARTLTVLQARLYGMWWMHGLPVLPQQYTRQQFRAELDAGNSASLAAEVKRRQARLAELRDAIPHGATPEELAASIEAYRLRHNMPAGVGLRRADRPPFWRPADPTIVVSGTRNARSHDPLTDPGPLHFRLAIDITDPDYPPPQVRPPFDTLKTSGLPDDVIGLVNEYARLLTTPALDPLLPAWQQPWNPLLYQWEIRYWPVPQPAAADATENWSFDGTTYTWADGDAKDSITYRGRRFLVPLPQHQLASQLIEHAHAATGALHDNFLATAEAVKGWDVLSQRADGFTDALASRNPAPGTAPPQPWRDLVQSATDHLPDPGPLPDPFGTWQPSGFQDFRGGQFAFVRLTVIDRFGQTCEIYLTGDERFHKPHRSPALTPGTRYADPQHPDRCIQLPPRLLQPARLRMDLLHHNGDAPVDLNAGTNPVAGWVIPNYVDNALMFFGSEGAALGEVRLALTRTTLARHTLAWTALPGSAITEPDALAADHPHLHGMVTSLIAQGTAAHAALMAGIHQALAAIDPGNPYGDDALGLLLGRPLALLRLQCCFELAGPPLTDPGWQYALDWQTQARYDTRATPARTGGPMPQLGHRWPVRLGNSGHQADGLIGYFPPQATTAASLQDPPTDYSRFHCVLAPTGLTTDQGYLTAIGPDNWPRLPADSHTTFTLTALADPLADLHATTDILPVTTCRLPQAFIRPALAELAISLRLSPLLTTTRRIPTTATAPGDSPPDLTDSLVLPHPTATHGTWDWAQLTGSTKAAKWQTFPVVPADTTARLDEDSPTARSGFLRLSHAISPTPHTGKPSNG